MQTVYGRGWCVGAVPLLAPRATHGRLILEYWGRPRTEGAGECRGAGLALQRIAFHADLDWYAFGLGDGSDAPVWPRGLELFMRRADAWIRAAELFAVTLPPILAPIRLGRGERLEPHKAWAPDGPPWRFLVFGAWTPSRPPAERLELELRPAASRG